MAEFCQRMSSVFTSDEFQSETYRWRESGLGTSVHIFYQTFQLEENAGEHQWKWTDDEEIDIDCICLKNFFDQNKWSFPGGNVEMVMKRLGTFDETKKILKDMDVNKAHFERFDCFFFAFLTFSEVDGRLHFDDKTLKAGLVPLEKILEVVSGLEVARGKPKIFLIQADDMSLTDEKVFTKGPGEEAKKVKIPTDADRLIIQSNIPQKLIPNERRVSFLIEAFIDVMLVNFKDKKHDLFSLTCVINSEVKKKISDSKSKRKSDLQVPLVTSTLTKRLLLHSDVQLV